MKKGLVVKAKAKNLLEIIDEIIAETIKVKFQESQERGIKQKKGG